MDKDKWLSVVKDTARARNISLSSFSEDRIKNTAGDADSAVNELNSRSGYKLSSEEQRVIKKEIEKRTR